MAINVVAGRDVIKSDAQEVIECLEEMLDRVRSGDMVGANRIVMYVVNDDLDAFEATVAYRCRAVLALGYLDLAKRAIMEDIFYV